MEVSLFDYSLPPERIAQTAVEPRDAARLLVLRRGTGAREHRQVRDLPELLDAGDLLVVNDTRVTPARLFARKESGGRVELLLLERLAVTGGVERWRAIVGASRAPRPGRRLELPGGFAALLSEGPDDTGEAVIEINGPAGVETLLSAHGLPPLPPYIRRAPDDPRWVHDRKRYQTVFADRPGAVAAPTAGLHFTPQLLLRLARAGIECASLTLQVGEGTFRPVRTLESRPLRTDGVPEPGSGTTDLFLAPGHPFRFVDALLTNFHLPRSTLLMLVAAFAGRELVLDAYREAVDRGYRFYSYGDAMLVL